jgi:hypothetical protein
MKNLCVCRLTIPPTRFMAKGDYPSASSQVVWQQDDQRRNEANEIVKEDGGQQWQREVKESGIERGK